MEIGKQTTVYISFLLVVFAAVVADPMMLKEIVGENIWINWGLAIVAFVIVFGNFLYPSIKEIVETGTLKVTNGSISTFVATFLGLIATIGFLYPDAILQIMGNLGLARYGGSAIYILGMIYNAKYPRNVNSIEPIKPAAIPYNEPTETITPEVKDDEEDVV